MTKVKQLRQQDTHIGDIATKFKSKMWDETLYFLDEHGIVYRKIKDGSNIFHAIMVPQTLRPYILCESHNALEHNNPTRLYNLIKRHYYWRKLHNSVISMKGCDLNANRSHSKSFIMLIYTSLYHNILCPSLVWVY